jgi:ribonuclease HII
VPDRRKFRCQARLERQARAFGYALVAGADEAGRGSLFGPVYAAAVILSENRPVRGVRDSKEVDSTGRLELAAAIRERAAAWAVASVDAFVIDRINIYQASCLAMKRAIERLTPPPDFLLLDAVAVDLPLPQRPVVHGDARCQAIAAASILAKVQRDACMDEWDEVYPQYGLRRHKGYTTPEHLEALAVFGPTVHHRFSYEPVRTACPRSYRTIFTLRETLHFRWDPGPAARSASPPASAGMAPGAPRWPAWQ